MQSLGVRAVSGGTFAANHRRMPIDAIDPIDLDAVSGGIDWNQVAMQGLYGGAAGATIGSATGFGAIPGAIGGALIGGGAAAYATWHQPTQK